MTDAERLALLRELFEGYDPDGNPWDFIEEIAEVLTR